MADVTYLHLADPPRNHTRADTWKDRARCAEIGNDEVFFPKRSGNARAARQICARCEVKFECLEYALAFEAPYVDDRRMVHGVWGGTTPMERRAILRQRRAEREAA